MRLFLLTLSLIITYTCFSMINEPLETKSELEQSPLEILTYILTHIEDTQLSNSLKALRATSKTFKNIIDDPQMSWYLIKILARKTNRNPLLIAQMANIPTSQSLVSSILSSLNADKAKITILPNLAHNDSHFIISLYNDYTKDNDNTYGYYFLQDLKETKYQNKLVFCKVLKDGTVDTTYGNNGSFIIPGNKNKKKYINQDIALKLLGDGNLALAYTSETNIYIVAFDKNGQEYNYFGAKTKSSQMKIYCHTLFQQICKTQPGLNSMPGIIKQYKPQELIEIGSDLVLRIAVNLSIPVPNSARYETFTFIIDLFLHHNQINYKVQAEE